MFGPATLSDLWFTAVDASGEPQTFLATPFNETEARLSPDGRYVASVEGPPFSAGLPEALFTATTIGATTISYDVAADGRRFVVVRTITPPDRHAIVVENWLPKVGGK